MRACSGMFIFSLLLLLFSCGNGNDADLAALPQTQTTLPADPIPAAPGYSIRRFGMEDGLLSNRIDAVAQDSPGNLWISNGLGLSEYDGRSFVNFRPAKAYGNLRGMISEMRLTKDGKICYPVSGGGIVFANDSFHFLEADTVMMTFFDPQTGRPAGYTPDRSKVDRFGNFWYVSNGLYVVSEKRRGKFASQTQLPGEKIIGDFTDDAGNYWVQTTQQLYRFDGTDFRSVTVALHGRRITFAHEDQRKNLWLKTFGDTLLRYDAAGKEQAFVFPVEHTYNFISQSIGEDDKGNVYVATTHFLQVLSHDGKLLQTLPLPMVRRMIKDRCGNIICISDSSCYRIADGKLTTIIAPGSVNAQISDGFVDRENNIWLCTDNGLLQATPSLVQSLTPNAKSLAATGQSSCNATSILLVDAAGRTWMNSCKGLLLFDPYNEKTPYRLFPEIDLDHTDFHIEEDPAGKIWIVTAKYEIRNELVMSSPHGSAWCFSDNTLQRIRYKNSNGKMSDDFSVGVELPDFSMDQNLLFDRRGECWMITSAGVLRCDGTNAKPVSSSEIKNPFLLRQSPSGEIFLAADGMLCLYDAQQDRFLTSSKSNSINPKRISGMSIDSRNRAWFSDQLASGTFIFVCNPGGRTDSFPAKAVGLIDTTQLINRIYFPGSDSAGRLWICSSTNGAFFIDAAANGPYSELSKIETAIQPGAIFKCLLRGNNLWLAGSDGLDHVQLQDITKPIVQHIGRPEGFIADKFQSYRFCRNGDLLVTGHPSYRISAASSAVLNTIPPVTRITSVAARDLSGDTMRSVDGNFNYAHNNLLFRFAGASLTEPKKNRFRYFLEGYDQRWSLPTSEDHIAFNNLPEGNYRLQVMSSNNSGRYSQPVTYAFTILPPWYRTWWAYAFFVVGGAVLLTGSVRWRTRRLQREKVRLEAIVEERTAEVKAEKKLVEEQHLVVEEKNREILESIRYAQRLQRAILPPEKFLQENLPPHFLLYLPKDIVAGDFYWAELLLDPAALFVAVADCTGHGVPGAMVSVVCSNALNRAVNEYGMTEPGVLLDKARELILDTYAKSEEEVKDGMDISLLRLDPEWKELQWSGAHNPLWIVRDGTLIELPADRQPVGLADHAQPFTTHRFALQKDDCLYLLSDGFADQFGGEKNKKFKSANLKKLLEQVATLPMNEQRDAIHRAFLEWKGENEQVDDITILGIRV